MIDTLGLLAEAVHLAAELGHEVREEPLGDSPGGACIVAGTRRILVNADLPASDRLAVIVAALAADPRTAEEPMSRALADRLARAAAAGPRG